MTRMMGTIAVAAASARGATTNLGPVDKSWQPQLCFGET